MHGSYNEGALKCKFCDFYCESRELMAQHIKVHSLQYQVSKSWSFWFVSYFTLRMCWHANTGKIGIDVKRILMQLFSVPRCHLRSILATMKLRLVIPYFAIQNIFVPEVGCMLRLDTNRYFISVISSLDSQRETSPFLWSSWSSRW